MALTCYDLLPVHNGRAIRGTYLRFCTPLYFAKNYCRSKLVVGKGGVAVAPLPPPPSQLGVLHTTRPLTTVDSHSPSQQHGGMYVDSVSLSKNEIIKREVTYNNHCLLNQ
jgi:hypothetical protein